MTKLPSEIKETPLQISMVTLLRLDFAEEDLMFTATLNGANLPKIRLKNGEIRCPEMHKYKMMGMLEGISDLLFWWPATREEDGAKNVYMACGFIEVKTQTGTLLDTQRAVRTRVIAMNGKYAVAREYETMRDTLIAWGVKCKNRVKFT